MLVDFSVIDDSDLFVKDDLIYFDKKKWHK